MNRIDEYLNELKRERKQLRIWIPLCGLGFAIALLLPIMSLDLILPAILLAVAVVCFYLFMVRKLQKAYN